MSAMIVLLLLGAGFLAAAKYAQRLDREVPGIPAEGQITGVVRKEGKTIYYVRFFDGTAQREGQSVTYVKTNRKYHAGDTVQIRYYGNKRGTYQFQIEDDTLVTAGMSTAQVSAKTFLALGIGAFVLAIVRLWSVIHS